jgi:hypothetical protein
MNNDFDSIMKILGFEDFEDGFESLKNLKTDDVFVRTAVLSKNNMIALLCVKTATEGGAICRVDPREAQPAVQLYDDPEKAIEWFIKASARAAKTAGSWFTTACRCRDNNSTQSAK